MAKLLVFSLESEEEFDITISKNEEFREFMKEILDAQQRVEYFETDRDR